MNTRGVRDGSNPSLTAAREAAAAVGALVAVPDFGPDRPAGAKDFNDLARLRGLEAVRKCIANAMTPDEVGFLMAARRLAALSPFGYDRVRRVATIILKHFWANLRLWRQFSLVQDAPQHEDHDDGDRPTGLEPDSSAPGRAPAQ